VRLRLREALRESLGQTYSVAVGRTAYAPLSDYGAITISYGSSPENADGLYWLGALQGAFALGHDPLSILDRGKRLEALTTETVRDTARAMFSTDRYTIVSLVPESQTQ
jgi:hypothetical protein